MRQSPSALQTDFYELTMAAVYHQEGLEARATFSLFAHRLPPNRGYMVAAGLEEALDYLEGFRFTREELDYLDGLGRFRPEFLDRLARTRFTGEVWALPEGTVCFAEEPLLEVTAPLIEAQLVETCLINLVNLHTTLTSKAARCTAAAAGRDCVDFSLRRCQGLEGGRAAARAAAVAGFAGTSNVAAARELEFRPVGTMAHSFVEAFGDEARAFRAFADLFPDHTVTLVDTYDPVGGLERSVELARGLRERGHELVGIRLDSGDLVELAGRARSMLDAAGLESVKVVISGSLDEHRIAELLAAGAEVDLFAVGTKLGSSADAPYLDLAYKLVHYDGRPTLKLSTGKESLVAPKQIWRRLDGEGRLAGDLLGLREEENPGEPLLTPVMAEGRRLGPRQGWRAAAERLREELGRLPEGARKLDQPQRVAVEVSPALAALQDRTRTETAAWQPAIA
jgi:nicotinate phosphoribosyltransferase